MVTSSAKEGAAGTGGWIFNTFSLDNIDNTMHSTYTKRMRQVQVALRIARVISTALSVPNGAGHKLPR